MKLSIERKCNFSSKRPKKCKKKRRVRVLKKVKRQSLYGIGKTDVK